MPRCDHKRGRGRALRARNCWKCEISELSERQHRLGVSQSRVVPFALVELERSQARYLTIGDGCNGHPVYVAEAFINPSRFGGTCYRAAKCQLLGLTTGRGKDDQTNKPNRPSNSFNGIDRLSAALLPAATIPASAREPPSMPVVFREAPSQDQHRTDEVIQSLVLGSVPRQPEVATTKVRRLRSWTS